MKVAVVIKHPGRDWEGDVRVDIIDVPEDADREVVRQEIMRKMLGPFQVLFITDKVNLSREFQMPVHNPEIKDHTQ
jgi:hypothetical protein